MSRGLRRALVLTGLAGAGALAYASLIERNHFMIRQATVPVLAPGQDPLTILHISDLHLLPRQKFKIEWLTELADLEPDLVINTGDNMSSADALPAVLDALAPLLERPGAFVFGSNDYFAPKPKNPARYLLPDPRTWDEDAGVDLPAAELAAAFRAAGWKDLTNRRDTVMVDGRRIALVGVDDPHLERDRFPEETGRNDGGGAVGVRAAGVGGAGATGAGPADGSGAAGSATTGTGASGSVASEVPVVDSYVAATTLRPAIDLRLGVTHAPYQRVLDAMADDGAELILAGHTHGGQLCLPGVGALVTNCDLDRGRAKGLHGWPGARPDEEGGDGSVWLHVSAGLGTSPYAPVRFFCPPEVTLLELVPAVV